MLRLSDDRAFVSDFPRYFYLPPWLVGFPGHGLMENPPWRVRFSTATFDYNRRVHPHNIPMVYPTKVFKRIYIYTYTCTCTFTYTCIYTCIYPKIFPNHIPINPSEQRALWCEVSRDEELCSDRGNRPSFKPGEPSCEVGRVVHGWYVPWEARVDRWIWLDLQEGTWWRHPLLQTVRVP